MDIFQTEEMKKKRRKSKMKIKIINLMMIKKMINEDKKDENKEQETDTSLDSDYDIDEYKLDEQLVDTDSDKQSSEQVIQKKILNNLNLDYKIYTNKFDEIIKAENLENADEANKLRKTLDQQLIGFQDVVTKLANKLTKTIISKTK